MDHDEPTPSGPDPIARLLQRAGKRPMPAPDAMARIHAHVHARWQASVRRQRRQRWFAIAAPVAVIALGTVWMLSTREQPPAAVVARLERGASSVDGLRAGVVLVGDRIETSTAGGAALRTLDAQGNSRMSLRLAPSSSLLWIAAARVELLRGGVYVDTEGRSAGSTVPLVVEAAGVSVEHLGTRFVTLREGSHVDVLVRDGTVRLQASGGDQLLGRGERGSVRIAAGGRAVITRRSIDRDGAAWSWVDAMAPSIVLDGQSLRTVALALAHEAGVELRFESAAIESEAASTMLHGPAIDLPPGQALQAIIATTRFELRRQADGSRLLVRAP